MPLRVSQLTVCGALLFALVIPTSAQAGNAVSIDAAGVVRVAEQAANAATITVSLEAPGIFRLVDPALTAFAVVPGCADLDAQTVRCENPNGPNTPLPQIQATLGALDDTWAPATPNAISWPQLLEGGAGRDTLTGSQGDDRFLVADGEQDTVTCGAGNDTVKTADANDVIAADCENRPATAPPTSPPSTTPPSPAPTNPIAPTLVTLTRSYTVPKFLPRKASSGKIKFRSLADLERDLAKGGITVDLDKQPRRYAKVSSALRRDIEDQDIIALSPKPGTKLVQNLARPPTLEVAYFDEAEDLASTGQACGYRDRVGARKQPFTAILEDQPVDTAIEVLEKRRCRFRIIKTLKSDTALSETVLTASVAVKKTGARRTLFVALVVQRPTRTRDLILSTTARPAAERGQRGYDYEGELSRGLEDGALTADARNVVSVQVRAAAPGEPVNGTEVELFDVDGSPLASQKTSDGGARTFTTTFRKPGTARLVARIETKQGRIVEGYQDVTVKARTERFCGEDGRRFAKGSQGWRETSATFPCTKAEALRKSLADAAAAFAKVSGRLAGIGTALRAPGDPADRIDSAAQAGVMVARIGVNSRVDGALNAPTGRTGLAALLLPPSGTPAAITTANGMLLPANATTADAVSFISDQGGGIISDNGGGLLGDFGNGLIGNDGAGLIGNDGAGLANLAARANVGVIDANRARLVTLPLVNNAGASLNGGTLRSVQLISDKGSGLISDKGAGLISDNGLGIFSGATSGFVPSVRPAG